MVRPPSSGSGATCACTTIRRCARRWTRASAWCPVFVLDDRLLDGRQPENRDGVPVRLPARTCARRSSSAAGTSSSSAARPSRSCRSWRDEHGATRGLLRLRRLAVRDGPRPARRGGAARGRASSRAARPGTSSPTSASPSPTPSSRRSGAPGSSCRGARSTARRARSPCPSGLTRRRDPGGAQAQDPAAPAARAGRPQAHAGLATTRRYDERHDRLDRDTSPAQPLPALRLRSAPASSRSAAGGAYARQLAWRDFYAHVLLHNPDNTSHAYRRELDAIEWDGTDEHFDAWREGRTGYPGRRRRHAPAHRDRLDAQPRPADHRLLPGQGPAHRLAPRRAALHALPARRRRRPEQRQLAVDLLASASIPRRCTAASTTRRSSSSATIPTARTCDRWAPDSRRRSSRSSTTRSSASARSRPTAAPAARKLPRIGTFTHRAPRAVHARLRRALHRGLAARARATSTTTQVRAALPRRRLERPGARRPAPGRGARPRGPSRPTTRSARSRRRRAIVSLDHDGTGYAEIDGPDRRRAAAARAATCARCSSTRPTRPPPGRSSPRAPATRRPTKLRDALSPRRHLPGAASNCSQLRRARRAARPQDAAPARHRARRRSRAGWTASRCWPRTPTRPTRELQSCRASARSTPA